MTDQSGSPSEVPDSSGWSATLYNKTAPFVYSPSYTAPVLDLLGAKSGERIIDFGCGSGEVTLQIAESVGEHGLVVGVDVSKSMVKKKHRILPFSSDETLKNPFGRSPKRNQMESSMRSFLMYNNYGSQSPVRG
jgi:SAM-dependent methyltransferase